MKLPWSFSSDFVFLSNIDDLFTYHLIRIRQVILDVKCFLIEIDQYIHRLASSLLHQIAQIYFVNNLFGGNGSSIYYGIENTCFL